MRSVNKSRVPEPKPQNKISFLFVACFLIVLAAVGISAWIYLENNRAPHLSKVTAEAKIAEPVEKMGKTPETPPLSDTENKPEEVKAASATAPEKEAMEEAVPAAGAIEKTPDTAAMPETKKATTGVAVDTMSGQPEEESAQSSPAKESNEEAPPGKLVEGKAASSPSASEMMADERDAASPSAAEKTAEKAPETTKPVDGGTADGIPEMTVRMQSQELPSTETEKDEPPKSAAVPLASPEAEKESTAAKTEPEKSSAAEPSAHASSAPAPEVAEAVSPEPLWKQNAMPFEDPLKRPRIALVISEMGISRKLTEQAIRDLPPAVTLAFNPYGKDLQALVDEARKAGHEVLLQLPMEPFGYPKIDPGPEALLAKLDSTENMKRLDWTLNRVTGYVGITNQMGSLYTASEDLIRPVLEVLKQKGLLYLDSKTASKSVAGDIAEKLSIPVTVNNRFLDHQANGATIDARLEDLERISKANGSAVGIGYPHPLTYNHMEDWIKSLEGKGFILAPISALVDRQDKK